MSWNRTLDISAYVYRQGRSLISEEDGPTAVEYAVMLALIIGVCASAVSTLADSLRGNLDNSADAIINASN